MGTPDTVMKKFKYQPTTGIVMLTLFYILKGLCFEHRDVIISSICYSEMLCDKLMVVIWSKC